MLQCIIVYFSTVQYIMVYYRTIQYNLEHIVEQYGILKSVQLLGGLSMKDKCMPSS